MPNPDYEVTNIRTSTRIDVQGALVDFYEVYFTTRTGDSSFVRVPRELPVAEMERLVADEAKKLIALRS